MDTVHTHTCKHTRSTHTFYFHGDDVVGIALAVLGCAPIVASVGLRHLSDLQSLTEVLEGEPSLRELAIVFTPRDLGSGAVTSFTFRDRKRKKKEILQTRMHLLLKLKVHF